MLIELYEHCSVSQEDEAGELSLLWCGGCDVQTHVRTLALWLLEPGCHPLQPSRFLQKSLQLDNFADGVLATIGSGSKHGKRRRQRRRSSVKRCAAAPNVRAVLELFTPKYAP